jgi:hypothetical protein
MLFTSSYLPWIVLYSIYRRISVFSVCLSVCLFCFFPTDLETHFPHSPCRAHTFVRWKLFGKVMRILFIKDFPSSKRTGQNDHHFKLELVQTKNFFHLNLILVVLPPFKILYFFLRFCFWIHFLQQNKNDLSKRRNWFLFQ